MADLSLTKVFQGMSDGGTVTGENFDAVAAAINADRAANKSTGWQDLSLANGFTTKDAQKAQVKVTGTDVELRGVVTASGGKVGVFATLESKPISMRQFICTQGSSKGEVASVYINPDGTLQLIYAADLTKQVSLDGIRFDTI